MNPGKFQGLPLKVRGWPAVGVGGEGWRGFYRDTGTARLAAMDAFQNYVLKWE